MNHVRIFRAFWFEHITRTWVFLLAALFAGVVVALALLAVFPDDSPKFETVYIYMLALAFPMQAIGLLYNGSFNESLSCRIPDSTLRLPVSSGAIMLGRFTFNLFCMTLITVAFYALFPLLSQRFQDALSNEWWYYAAIMVGLISILQFVALATSRTGDWAIAFLSVTTFVYLFIHSRIADTFAPVNIAWFHATVAVVSFPATWITLHVFRRGAGLSPSAFAIPRSVGIRTWWSSSHPFKSAHHAQLWFETRRMWAPVSRVFIFLVILGVAVPSLSEFLPLPGVNGNAWQNIPQSLEAQSLHRLQSLVLFSAAIASLLGGMIVAIQNRRMQLGAMASFLYLRPMSTAQLTEARIKAAIRILALPILLIGISFAAYDFRSYIIHPFVAYSGTYEPSIQDFAAAYALILLPAIAVIWIVFWTWNLVAVGFIYVGLAIFILLMDAVSLSAEERYVANYLVVVALIGIALYAFVLWNRLVDKKVGIGLPLTTVALILAFVGAKVHIAQSLDAFHELFSDSGRANVGPVFMMFTAPLVTIPLALHWTRHR